MFALNRTIQELKLCSEIEMDSPESFFKSNHSGIETHWTSVKHVACWSLNRTIQELKHINALEVLASVLALNRTIQELKRF